MGARLLSAIARWAQHRSSVHQDDDLIRTTDERSYRAWRHRELSEQLTRFFDVTWIAGRNVVDFGCGTGELCALLWGYRPKTLVGVDQSADAIRRAEGSIHASARPGAAKPVFICNEQPDRLALEGESVDLICCFDVVEHIPDVSAVAGEWNRLLRRGGRVWIWWSPWRGPYGHHLESLIPLPWVHLIMPERTLFEACAMRYEAPDFMPRLWDRDPVTGAKKPNKWLKTRSFHPFLNRMTRREFESIVRRSGLSIARREIHGFSGSVVRKATRVLLPLPLVGDCVVSFYVYELTRR